MGLCEHGRAASVLAITPACNEAEHLESLAASLAAQSIRPRLWVIATNGCTDNTEAVADRIAQRYPEWVSALHLGATGRRSFAAKAHAVSMGVRSATVDDYDFVACIDGDVVLPVDYFDRVAEAMGADPDLGIAGGVYREPVGTGGRIGGHRGGHVPGPGQVLRSEVYSEIGGYKGLEFGGLDTVACYSARKLGWKTVALDDLEFHHVRAMGSAGGVSRVRAEYLKGRQDWDVGNAVWFEGAKLARRLRSPPIVVGGLARAAGFARGALSRKRGTDKDFVKYVRQEQRQRLAATLRRAS